MLDGMEELIHKYFLFFFLLCVLFGETMGLIFFLFVKIVFFKNRFLFAEFFHFKAIFSVIY